LNPDIAGTAQVYTGLENSAIEYYVGDGTNVVTNGFLIDSKYGQGNSSIQSSIDNILRLGATIAGESDILVISVSPLDPNLDVYGGITFRELV